MSPETKDDLRYVAKLVLIVVSAYILISAIAIQATGQEINPAQPQCVRIQTDEKGRYQSWGTGALIGPGLIATCNHNVIDRKSNTSVKVHFPNNTVFNAKVVFTDKGQDVALLTFIGYPGVTPLEVATELPPVGTRLSIQGYTVADGYKRQWGTLKKQTYGNASGTKTWHAIAGADARQGDSGGPVIDEQGRFVGVLWGSDHVAGNPETQFTRSEWVLEQIERLDLEVNVEEEERDTPNLYAPGEGDIPLKYANRYHNRKRTKKFYRRAV